MPDEADQRIDVEVFLDQIGQQAEPLLACAGERDAGAAQPKGFAQESRSQGVAFERAVPHGAENLTGPRSAGEVPGSRSADDPSMMDLVAGDRRAQPLP